MPAGITWKNNMKLLRSLNAGGSAPTELFGYYLFYCFDVLAVVLKPQRGDMFVARNRS